MRNLATRQDVLRNAAADLVSITPLIFREVRRKLIRMTLDSSDVYVRPLEFEIMSLLKETGTLHLAEIGDKLHVAKAQMTHLVDKLADLNMVVRETDMTDRRAINVTLTAQGRAFLEERQDKLVGTAVEAMSGLTREEIEDLANTLKKLKNMLSRFTVSGSPNGLKNELTRIHK